MTTPDLVVLGSLTVDNVLTSGGQALPASFAGNVLYAAMGARLWSPSVGIVTRAGSGFSQPLLDTIAAAGIDTAGVRWLDAPHGMNCAFCYAEDGSRQRRFPEPAVAKLPHDDRGRFVDYTTLGDDYRYATWNRFSPSPDDIPAQWRDSSAAFHCAAMPVTRHIELSTTIRQDNPSAYMQVDSPWYDARDPSRPYAETLFALIDRLLPSEADLAVVFEDEDWRRAATPLLRQGLKGAVFKLGAQGCVIMEGTEVKPITVPACSVSVKDPTGAGDAFCGGFLAGWAQQRDTVAAALRGTVSASFAVEGNSLEGLFKATAGEAERRLERLRVTMKDQKTERGAKS